MFGRSYCGICGSRVEKNQAPERFGKHFCSEEHAQQYAQEMEKARQATLANQGNPRSDDYSAQRPQRRGGGCC